MGRGVWVVGCGVLGCWDVGRGVLGCGVLGCGSWDVGVCGVWGVGMWGVGCWGVGFTWGIGFTAAWLGVGLDAVVVVVMLVLVLVLVEGREVGARGEAGNWMGANVRGVARQWSRLTPVASHLAALPLPPPPIACHHRPLPPTAAHSLPTPRPPPAHTPTRIQAIEALRSEILGGGGRVGYNGKRLAVVLNECCLKLKLVPQVGSGSGDLGVWGSRGVATVSPN